LIIRQLRMTLHMHDFVTIAYCQIFSTYIGLLVIDWTVKNYFLQNMYKEVIEWGYHTTVTLHTYVLHSTKTNFWTVFFPIQSKCSTYLCKRAGGVDLWNRLHLLWLWVVRSNPARVYIHKGVVLLTEKKLSQSYDQ
jgi:hypothetical protein